MLAAATCWSGKLMNLQLTVKNNCKNFNFEKKSIKNKSFLLCVYTITKSTLKICLVFPINEKK